MTPSRSLATLLVVVLAANMVACRKGRSVPPHAIARIGSRFLTTDEFRRYLERNAGTDMAQMSPEVSSALLDQFIEEVLLADYAAARGVEIGADKIAAAVRKDPGSTAIEKRDQLRRAQLVFDATSHVPEPSDDEVRNHYMQRQQEFTTDDAIHVRQILVRNEDLANRILAELNKGGDFVALSEKHSTAPNASHGGDIGYVSRGELPKIFEDELFRMTPGGPSHLIRTDSTFHIFKVDDRKPAGTMSLEAAAPVIRTRLKEDAMRREVGNLLAKARNDIPVTILTKRLPFPYSGTLQKSTDE